MTARSGVLPTVRAALFGLSFVLTRAAVPALGPAGVSAARALLVPIFGVLWRLVLLDEPVPPLSVLGMVAILMGLHGVVVR